MSFDRQKDKIAVTVTSLKFKKGASSIWVEDVADLFYSEPYLVTVAIDSKGIQHNQIAFNVAEYPFTKRGTTIKMSGDGHLVYGPGNPSEYVAVSVLVMESARESVAAGTRLSTILQSNSLQQSVKDITDLLKGKSIQGELLIQLLQGIGNVIVKDLQNTQDRILFRTEGVYLRDTAVPYSINREFIHGNDFAEITLHVIPLDTPNGQGPIPKSLTKDAMGSVSVK
jgi:hypothetical protein